MIPFNRDRFTWLAYSMLGYYAFIQASLGPLLPFLGTELDLNYTERGLHGSAYALGMVLAGLGADRLARRFSRHLIFWAGGAGMAIFAVLLTFGKNGFVTIACTFMMAYIGSFLLVMIQATLADKHGEKRAVALTEANILASVTATLSPLVVGLGQALHIGWRLVLYVGAIVWGISWLIWHRVPMPAGHQSTPDVSQTQVRRPLPKAFWAYWLVVFLSVSIEWCMILWSADFLEKVAGLGKDWAATSVSIFFAANVVGRAAGSYLTRRFDTGKLLLIAIGIVIVGFPIFWLGRTTLLNVTGLMLCGLGVANLFPLTLSAASNTAPDQANAASARVSLAAGLAILIAPQFLASTADLVGIQTAYGIVVVLLAGVVVVTYYANQLSHKSDSPIEAVQQV
jgi:fucose permease